MWLVSTTCTCIWLVHLPQLLLPFVINLHASYYISPLVSIGPYLLYSISLFYFYYYCILYTYFYFLGQPPTNFTLTKKLANRVTIVRKVETENNSLFPFLLYFHFKWISLYRVVDRIEVKPNTSTKIYMWYLCKAYQICGSK